MEDYLKAILVLHQQHGYVRCIDVADYLGVSKPSVSRAVKELTKSGHIIKKDGTLYLLKNFSIFEKPLHLWRVQYYKRHAPQFYGLLQRLQALL